MCAIMMLVGIRCRIIIELKPQNIYSFLQIFQMINECYYSFTSFHPVVGGGPNAAVIHYSRNDQKVSLLIKS